MKKLNLRLVRLVKNSKGQFITITVVVVIALLIYVSFSMTAVNLKNTVDYYYNLTNFGDLFVQLVKIPGSAIEKLRDIDGIEKVQGRISFDVPLKVEDEKEKVKVRIVSVPIDKEKINELYMLEGKNITDQLKGVVVLEQFAKARGIKVGDRINPYINGRSHNLQVVGIAASSEYIYLMENEQTLLPAPEKFGVLYVSEEFAQLAYGYKDSYNEVLIKVRDKEKIDDIEKILEDRLDRYGVKRIIQRKDQLSNSMLSEEIKQLEKTSTAIPLLFLMVAAIIIYIMLMRLVKNDRVYIGLLKALGYGNGQIISYYIKYALIIGFAGAILGDIGGIFISGLLANVYIQYYNIPLLKLDIYYVYLIYAILLTSIFCMISGFMGARSVLTIMPADSMRPEPPKTGGRILLERFKFLWSHLSFSLKFVIRNIGRSKKRFAFLVFGIALSFGINTVPIFQGDAMTAIFSIHYGEFQKMDYNIDFSRPMNGDVIMELKHIIEVDSIEPKLEYPFEISNGWRKKVVNIIGVPRDTTLYDFKNSHNESIKFLEDGILITEGLARKLKVHEGDKIRIENFIPGKEDIEIVVEGIVKQYLGINGYMNIKQMDELLADKGMVTGVSITSKDHVEEKLKNIKNISAVQSVEEMKNSFMQFMDSVVVATGVLMLFGGILGFAIVYNSTVISISERNMEFSSLRIMGFDEKEIFHMITKENAIMTFIGIIMGIPLGWGMCKGIAEGFNTDLYAIPLILTPKTFIISAIGTIVFVMIAQLATLRKIRNLDFIEALKNRIS